MKEDKETKLKLLASAKAEFLEKGYMQASLRNICKNAGVTTGALYFFFQDKEDLFASLVEDIIEKLNDVLEQHYASEVTQSVEELLQFTEDGDDVAAMSMVIHLMYQNYDACMLLLAKSQGSRFEHYIDRLVDISEQHYRCLADRISDYLGIPRLAAYPIHWFSHMQVDAFIYMLTHVKTEEAAMKSIEPIIKYMISGWCGLFQ